MLTSDDKLFNMSTTHSANKTVYVIAQIGKVHNWYLNADGVFTANETDARTFESYSAAWNLADSINPKDFGFTKNEVMIRKVKQ